MVMLRQGCLSQARRRKRWFPIRLPVRIKRGGCRWTLAAVNKADRERVCPHSALKELLWEVKTTEGAQNGQFNGLVIRNQETIDARVVAIVLFGLCLSLHHFTPYSVHSDHKHSIHRLISARMDCTDLLIILRQWTWTGTMREFYAENCVFSWRISRYFG